MTKRWLGILLLLTMACGVVLINRYYIPTLPTPEAVVMDTPTVKLELKEPKVVYGMVLAENNLVIEDKIKRNQRLGDILEQYNVPAKFIHQLSLLSRKI